VPNKGPARCGIAGEEPGVPVGALVKLSHLGVLHDMQNAWERDASQQRIDFSPS
jgi:hypothetical protein